MSSNIPPLQETQVKHGILMDITVNTTTYYVANTYGYIDWNGNRYAGLGHFLGLSEVQDDLKATNNSLSVSLSGLPNAVGENEPEYITTILNSNFKGSRVKIYRAFFNLQDNKLITDQVYLRFNGYISNYTIVDNVDVAGKSATNTVVVNCSSINAILEKQISGRRTNSADAKKFYPTDIGFDEVVKISGRVFDFGKPYSGGPGGGSNTGGGGGKNSDFQPVQIEF